MLALRVATVAIIAALPMTPAHAQDATTVTATARMMDKDGKEVGTVTFKETPSGKIWGLAEITGVPAGPHGLHIHETGKCDGADGFKSAGGHYTGEMKHGVMAEGGPHAGDLPNVHAAAEGVVKAEFFTDGFTLGEGGKNPLKDADGSAVVLHAQPDDYTTQPTGDAGDRLACGVVE